MLRPNTFEDSDLTYLAELGSPIVSIVHLMFPFRVGVH